MQTMGFLAYVNTLRSRSYLEHQFEHLPPLCHAFELMASVPTFESRQNHPNVLLLRISTYCAGRHFGTPAVLYLTQPYKQKLTLESFAQALVLKKRSSWLDLVL